MKPTGAESALGDGEFLSDFSARFGAPHAPEVDAQWRGRLFAPEIAAALAAPQDGGEPDLARRGRLRRLAGDADAARRDLAAALEREPARADAAVWLAELDLGTPRADASLTAVLGRAPDHAPALLHRGAGRLMRRRAREAVADLERFAALRPDSAAGLLLLALSRARAGAGTAADGARAGAAALWSAPHLLRAAALRGSAAAAAVEDALDAEPNYALVVGALHEAGAPLERVLARVGRLAVAEPARFATFDGLRGLYRPLDPDAQLSLCRRLVELRPERAWSWGLLGRALLQGTREPDRAREGMSALDRAVALKPDGGWMRAWRAQGWIGAGDSARALADFDACVRLQPHYHRVYAWRGTLLRTLGRVPEALADLDRAVALDPQYHFGWRQRSLARRAAGDLAGAAEDLGRAFRIKPKYEWDRGARRGEEDWKAAEAELGSAAQSAPRPAALLAWRGRVRRRLGNEAGAAEDFARALAADPDCALARASRGRALAAAGRFAEAAAEFERALAAAPDFWAAYDWLARAHFEAGRDAAAYAVLRRARRARPRAPWSHFAEAEFRARRGKWRAAAAAAERTLAIDGQYGHAHLLAAEANLRLGDLPAARGHLERAERLLPGDVALARLKKEFAAPPTRAERKTTKTQRFKRGDAENERKEKKRTAEKRRSRRR